MEVKVENLQIFSWKPVEETIELVYEEHSHASPNNEDPETKNHDIHNLKKIDDDNNLDSEVYLPYQEGTRETFEGQPRLLPEHKLTALIEGTLNLDMVNNVFLLVEKNTLPPITVRIDPNELQLLEEAAAGKDWKLVVEVLFAQKSHSSEKYKVFRGGIGGAARKRYIGSETIQFRNLKVNYASSVDKNSKILIALYQLTEARKKLLREVLISKDLFVIEEPKLMVIDSQEGLHQYFDLFGSEFMDKLPTPFKATRSERQIINDEIATLEKYLTKKNKKFLNVVYLSFKFPHFCELYFRMPEGSPIDDASEEQIPAKRAALSSALTEAAKQIEELQLQGDGQNICNYVNPLSKLIFRVNINLRRVRIFVRKELTQILSIVVAEEWKQPQGFARFQTAKELKEFYLEYYSYARKCKSSENYGKPPLNSNSVLNGELAKKAVRKPEDEEYQEDGEQDQSEVDQQVNEGCIKPINQDSADKKAKKHSSMLKRLQTHNKKPSTGNLSPRQSKYPTRNKTRAQDCQQSSNNESKRNQLNKKVKEKEAQKKPLGSGLTGIPGMPGIGMMNPLMPFQVMGPGGQNPMLGMFPLVQNAQKKEGAQTINGQKMPQIAAIPIGMNGMGSIPGMPLAAMNPAMGFNGMNMMPGFAMPMGMVNPAQQQSQNAKKDSKDGKEQQNNGQTPKAGMPMLVPYPGMGGMQIPGMGGMVSPFGMMQGGQGQVGVMSMPSNLTGLLQQGVPTLMQGPNGQTIMVMSVSPQQLLQMQQTQLIQQQAQQQLQQRQHELQNQQGQQSNNSQNNSTQNSTNSQQSGQTGQGMISGMIPAGMMMYPGMQGGMQSMMMPQMGQLGQMGMINMGAGNPMMINPNAQSNNPNGNNPLAAMMGMQGMGNFPMGYMMPNPQNNDSKATDKNNQAKTAQQTAKKQQSAKKDDKNDSFLAPSQNNSNGTANRPAANTNGLPSFLTPGAAQFPPASNPTPSAQSKDDKQTAATGTPKAFPGMPQGFNPSMMNFMGGLNPELLQQMSAQGQNMGLPSGMSMPQNMGFPPGLPVSMINPQMLNLTPQQKQMIQMQQQMQMQSAISKLSGMGSPFPPKKDEDKK